MDNYASEYDRLKAHKDRIIAKEQARHVVEGLRLAIDAIETDRAERQPSRNWPGMRCAVTAIERAIEVLAPTPPVSDFRCACGHWKRNHNETGCTVGMVGLAENACSCQVFECRDLQESVPFQSPPASNETVCSLCSVDADIVYVDGKSKHQDSDGIVFECYGSPASAPAAKEPK